MDRIVAMRTFGRVVEAGSFTKAADTLEMSKGAVTRMVQHLESHLGMQLLTRTTRKVSVTREGAAYYERTVALLRELEDVDAGMVAEQHSPRGRLRVDVTAALGRLVFVPAFGSFHQRYPDIQLELGISDRRIDLLVDNVDCAIRGGEITDQYLVARRIGAFDFVTAAAPAYLAQHGMPRRPGDLDNDHPMVGYMSARTGRAVPFEFHRDGERLEVEGRTPLLVNDLSAYVEAGIAGVGIVQAARYAVQQHLDSGALVPVLTDWTAAVRPAHVVYAPNRYVSARLRVFIEWAAQLFQTHPLLRPQRTGAA